MDRRSAGRAVLTALAAACLFAAVPAAPAAAQDALAPADSVSQPTGWDDELRMAEPEDLNPDPHILEFDLEARVQDLEIIPGTTTPVWTYNGSLPGPMIRAQVGDRLIVHFKNSLPEATTIHWHGVRVPNDMDGAPGLTQLPIQPGETFEYDFVLRDAGTFWYHPHFNSPHQVSRGLYGAIVVEDPAEPDFGDELVVMLSDIALDPDGAFQPSDRGGTFGTLFGREGGTLLVNGKIAPTVLARAGKPQRWRFINAAITRYFPIALRNNSWTRIGGDGGLAARSETLPRAVIVPSERMDMVLVPSDEPGTENGLYWLPVDRGWGTAVAQPRQPVMYVNTVDAPPVQAPPVPETLRAIPPIDIGGATEKTIELTIDTAKPQMDMMGINGVAHDFMVRARVGETQVWTVVNDTDFDHPFHLHGYFFQVLDDSRIPEWKDTANVPAHTQMRLAVRFDDRPGMWMLHCHILDHAEAGMMGHLFVAGAADAEPPAHAAMSRPD